MPYALQAHYDPHWDRQFPAAWLTRLREISPVTDQLAHLVPRFFPEQDWWNAKDETTVGGGMWALYSCTPKAMIRRERAAQFERHWSELPTEGERVARRVFVTSYQHYMWHVHGLEANVFWLLQGFAGGTPATYSKLEVKVLEAENLSAQPLPLGAFPACRFDERAITAIAARDRFYQAGQRLETLAQMDRPDYQRAEDVAAEQAFRTRFLENWRETVGPQAEFLTWYLRKSESHQTLPDAPDGLNDAIAQFKDTWIEHGSVPHARTAPSRLVAVH